MIDLYEQAHTGYRKSTLGACKVQYLPKRCAKLAGIVIFLRDVQGVALHLLFIHFYL